ncbi:MAG: hypothetical protein ACOCWG_04165 [bacterium]
MKRILTITLVLLITLRGFSQNESINHYKIAVQEIKEMMDDKKPINLTKAVFLVENAYMNGVLDWDSFNSELKKYLPIFQKMIDNNGFEGYKTAKNWAIHTYMTDTTNTKNGYQRFHYDYENYISDTLGLVWNLLMNVDNITGAHLGNCRSLPLLYKLWCNEFGAKSYLSNLPMHLYIRQQDEQGIWWNIELTSFYKYMPTEDYVIQFKIKDEARNNGLYMKALSEKECLIILLEDLIHFYEVRTSIYYDEFVKECTELGLRYWYNSTLLLRKFDYEKYHLDSKMKKLGLNNYNQISYYPKLVEKYKIIDNLAKYIEKIGYTEVSTESYSDMFKGIEEKANKYPKQK